MRRSGLLWGFLILFAGVVFLLDNLGFLPVSAWSLIFPSVLILMGLWFLIGPLVFRQVIETRSLSIPLDNGVTDARLKLRHGAGELQVDSSSDGINLLEGTFIGGVDDKFDRKGSTADIKLKMPEMDWWGFPSAFPKEGLKWDMHLNKGIAYSINLKTGASRSCLDLRDLIVTEITLETGASNTEILLPEQAGFTKADLHFGTASVDLSVPQGVAARIKVNGALMNTDEIDRNRFPQTSDGFVSPDYDTAVNKIDIMIEAGVGKVVIK